MSVIVGEWRSPPLWPLRQAGSVPAGNGYLWATGKVLYLKISHSQRRCKGTEDRREESGCPFKLFIPQENGRDLVLKWAENESDRSRIKTVQLQTQVAVQNDLVCFQSI